MPATPKSTPKKAAASPAATPGRMTRSQAARVASTPKPKTPSPNKKSSPAAKTPDSAKSKSKDSPSPSSSKKTTTPSKQNGSPKASPKSSAKKATSSPAKTDSPSKATGSQATLARKPTSALATAQPITAEYSDEEEEDDDEVELDADEEEDDEEEDESDVEDGLDVSDKGMQRLMDALGEDGLDDVDMAALQELAGDEDEDDDDEEDEDEEDGEDEESDVEDEEENDEAADDQDIELPSVKPSTNGDTLAASIARSGLVEAIQSEDEEDEEMEEHDDEDKDEEEEEEIAYEDLPDDIELPESAKASRVQRIKVNNESALRRIYDDIRLDSPASSSKLPWIETMRVSYPVSIASEVTDVENDLERELAFYKQALHAAVEGKKLVETAGIPFSRPSDYFAEMVKTDEHMEKIRQKLLDESAAIKASEAAKKQRELKKFGKKVQVEKLEERLRKKKELNEKISGLKRKHSSMDDGDDGDEFDVRLEEALADKPGRTAKKGAAAERDGPNKKSRMPRSARDAKYGFGGKKRYAKSNTAESTNDFSVGPTRGARGSKPKVSGKAGFRPKQKSGAAKRPGKARRAGQR
ncbi:Ebp2-domain-containing protein [Testicularia cyperi]|uniref:Ebp2-domain-containing protein n=1 Tax=Testicularia cyperi TaxID=1882483 RepID=A0A317XGD8_9BASI|nr:Ebp2-domain-containing protein [Testicularia cyperi]